MITFILETNIVDIDETKTTHIDDSVQTVVKRMGEWNA